MMQYRLNHYLLSFVIVIALFGWIMVTTSSMTFAYDFYGSAYQVSIKQFIHIILMFLMITLFGMIPIEKIKRSVPWLLLLSLTMLGLLYIPILGKQVNGSTRWLNLGPVSFEVSELVKWVMILYFAQYLDKQENEKSIKLAWVKLFLIVGLLTALLLSQPDFGSVLVITWILLIMAFLSGIHMGYFIGVCSLAVALLYVLLRQKSYRLDRLSSFQDPWADPFGQGYQLIQSLIAIGSGGLWGVGIGSSIQKWSYLPESHTDFIFSIIIEELGAVVGVGLIVLYAMFILYIIRCGCRQKDRFCELVHYGVAAWIFIQTIIAMGVPIGLLPTKGLTLPLISYGGSSLLMFGMAFGVLIRMYHESSLGDEDEAC